MRREPEERLNKSAHAADSPAGPRWGVRILVSLAVLAAAFTVLAAQIDYGRRHTPGVSPLRYLLPQLLQIWLPGLGTSGALATAARLLWRSGRLARAAGSDTID